MKFRCGSMPWPPMRFSHPQAKAAALLLGLGLALLGLVSHASAWMPGDPTDITIQTEQGDLIKVTYTKLLVGAATDRSDICFTVASYLSEWKTFVFENQHQVFLDGSDPGPVCFTRYNNYDYDSYDNERKRQVKKGARGKSFNQRVVTPMNTSRHVALYHGNELKDEDKVYDQPIMMPAGYKATVIWLKDDPYPAAGRYEEAPF